MESVLRVATAAETVYIKVDGEGVAHLCPTLRTFIERMVKANKESFIVDLADCRYVDSSFLGTLLSVIEHQKRIVVINARRNVTDRFDLLGLTQIIPIKSGVAVPFSLSLHRLPVGVADKRALAEAVERAHRQLIKADRRNRARFAALLKLLKKELQQQ